MHQMVLARSPEARRTTSLRFVRSSSASLPGPVLDGLTELFAVPVVEAYGMTEASHQMTCNPLPPGTAKRGSVGIATGIEVAILDAEHRVLPPGERGEVAIRGATVVDGYENNPAANEAAFTAGWFRTGDEGVLDDEGYLFLTGRLKEQINRGGEKISPLEIDEVAPPPPGHRRGRHVRHPPRQAGRGGRRGGGARRGPRRHRGRAARLPAGAARPVQGAEADRPRGRDPQGRDRQDPTHRPRGAPRALTLFSWAPAPLAFASAIAALGGRHRGHERRRGRAAHAPARRVLDARGVTRYSRRLAVRGRDACPCARLRLWTLTWRPAQEDAPDVSRDTGRSAGTPRARRRTAARRATAVMVVSSALLAVSPLGSIVAVAEDPPTTSAAGADDPGLRLDLLRPQPHRHRARLDRRRASDATTTTGPSSSTTNPQGPSVDTVDPTTTTTPGDSTTSSSAPPLAVSAILQAANPFDATHGFTVLARHAGELRAGTTLGAVAVGGDLRFGPYTVTPTPPAQLDETPIGLLVGGSVGLGSSAGRLTVGDDARLLIGKVGAAQTAAVDGGVAVLPAGADVAADPQLRANGPQEPQTVSSPGTFERAFGGVFADLAARGRTLAKLKPTLTPTAADGGVIASAGLPRADVHLAADDGDGPSVWSVHAADLAQIGSITIDPAPTEQRPLVINVDGDGGKVLLDRAVTVERRGPGRHRVERRRREGRRRGAAARRQPARPDGAGARSTPTCRARSSPTRWCSATGPSAARRSRPSCRRSPTRRRPPSRPPPRPSPTPAPSSRPPKRFPRPCRRRRATTPSSP